MSAVAQVTLPRAAAPEEPQYRAPARRISAAGQADRTAQAFEGALSEFKAMFESMQEEIATLRKEVTDLRAQAVVENATLGAALQAQADTVSTQAAMISAQAATLSAQAARIDRLTEEVTGKASHGEVNGVAQKLREVEGRLTMYRLRGSD